MLAILILCLLTNPIHPAETPKDSSHRCFRDYLFDQRDSISAQIKSNCQSIIHIGSLLRDQRQQTSQSQVEEIERISANNTELWTKRRKIEQECQKLLAVSPTSRVGNLYDELDGITIQIEKNNQRICQIRSLQLNQTESHLIISSHSQEQLRKRNARLSAKNQDIEHALGELMAVSETESPDFRCLLALSRGLKNKSLPSDIVQFIVMDAKERMYQEHVQFIISYGIASERSCGSEKPIRSLKNIIFPDDCFIINLRNHPIESYENTQFRNLSTETLTYNELDLSNTTMNADKLKQIKFPSNLQTLDLSRNPVITSFENVSFPPNLLRLVVSGCALNAQKIKSLNLQHNLERIEMDGNQLHGQMGAVNELISGFPQLDYLDLSYCNLTASDYEQLSVAISAHPTLQILYLSGNSNDNISALQLPNGLDSLDWNGVSWNHQQLEELNRILPDNLKYLSIEDFNDSDPIIEHMECERHIDIS